MKLVGIDLAPASSSAPGTARYVSQQMETLLSIPVPWKWLPTFESSNNPLYPKFGGVDSIIVKGHSLALRASLRLGAAWKKHRCDLGFCPAYFTPLFGPPVVTNFFDSNIYEHFDTWVQSGRLLNALIIRLLSDFSVHRSARLFTLSNYCQGFLHHRFPHRASRFIVTPPGVSFQKNMEGSSTPLGWFSHRQESFFLYVGTFSENKNQARLIEAYLSLRKQKAHFPALVLIGPYAPDFYQRSLARLLEGVPREWVILPGRVPETDLIWAYHNALAYIQPSIAEGFGLPVIEAMSYGLPVACSNTTSLPETAGDGALLFDPFSPASIAGAMVRLFQEPDLRMELIAKGEKRWREFTWEKNAKIVIAEIEEVLKMDQKI